MGQPLKIQTNKVFEILQQSQKRISVMQGGSRCFTGETLVRCKEGYKQIMDIEPGDEVYCIDDNFTTVIRKVVNKFRYKYDHTRHKVITFELVNNQRITCTYDHKLRQNEGYVRAVDIAQGMLDAGVWVGWEVSNQHTWKAISHEVQEQGRGRWHADNEASEGCEWVFADNDIAEWEVYDNKDAQSSCGTLRGQPLRETASEPYQQRQSGQSCGEFRVGHLSGEFRPHDEARKADFQQWGEEWKEYPYREYCKVDTKGIQALCSDGKGLSKEVRSEDLYNQGHTEGQELGKRILGIDDVRAIIFHETSEPVYDIEVDEFHNYFVTKDNYISHNSGKTYNIILFFIIKLLQERGNTLSIVRQSMPSIKGSVLRDFVEILLKMGIYSEDNHNKTEQTYNLNGNLVEFVSVDQPHKIRGRKRQYLFMNEVTEMSYEAWVQLSMRTEKKIVVDYNPSDEYHWIFDKVITRDDTDFHITTYRDNPFLPKDVIDEIERLKDADENYWLIYGLGQKGNMNDTIYTHFGYYSDEVNGEVVYGLDFGYNNPSAMVKCVFSDGAVYVEEILYETKLTTNDLVEKIKALNISPYDEIFCDAAEPKTIEELCRCGLNAKPADKDVREGIRKVKSTRLFVHQNSTNLIKELKNYKWKTDKNGKKLDEPVKFNDHACFIGETMITTINGLKRIDSIVIGDYVLTSEGFKKVNFVFNNGMHYVNKYRMQFDTFELTLICTPNHKVKTNEGWKEISKLQSGMTVFLNNFTKGNHLNYNQENDILTTDLTKCIGGYGNVKMVKKDQEDFTYTTLTEIHGITDQRILNLLNQKDTYQITQNQELKKIKNGSIDSKKKESNQLQNGINQKQVWIGTENTQKNIILGSSTMEWINANNAVKSTIEKRNMQNFVIQTAKLKHLEKEGSWQEIVYDLNIDTVHEYFANGILVHNCDSIRYSIYTKTKQPQLTWGII